MVASIYIFGFFIFDFDFLRKQEFTLKQEQKWSVRILSSCGDEFLGFTYGCEGVVLLFGLLVGRREQKKEIGENRPFVRTLRETQSSPDFANAFFRLAGQRPTRENNSW